ncbi:hypothetical protein HDU82_007356 [Entophlyctis luteolus]|nr:hypothetical protein HDU82_007356 [Entophlyctis luteolus]
MSTSHLARLKRATGLWGSAAQISSMSTSIAAFVAETRALLGLAETTQHFGFLRDTAREPVAKQLNTYLKAADDLAKIVPNYDTGVGMLVSRVRELVPGGDTRESGNPDWSFSVEKETVEMFKHALGRVLLKVREDLENMSKDPEFKNNRLDLTGLENLIFEIGPIPPDASVSQLRSLPKRTKSSRIMSFFSSFRPRSAASDGRDLDDFISKQSSKKSLKAVPDSPQKSELGIAKSENEQELSEAKRSQNQETSQTRSIARCQSLHAGDKTSVSEWQYMPPLPPKNGSSSSSMILNDKPRLRSKSLVPADTAFLLVTNEPLPRTKSVKSMKGNQTNDPAINASRASIAAALFGDPNASILDSPADVPNIPKIFSSNNQDHEVTLEVKMMGTKMKMYLRHSKMKVFEVDLSLWESKSQIKIHDFREEYKRTEIIELSRIPKYPNVFTVAGHTVMLSNLFPLGNIVIESPNKICMFNGLFNASYSSKPLFSITGEIKLGRFMVVGRDTESRAQQSLGSSSGWAVKRKLKLAGDENMECNLQICGSTWNDVAGACSNADQEISQNQMMEIQNDNVTRHSQLLMAGIALALAPKDVD